MQSNNGYAAGPCQGPVTASVYGMACGKVPSTVSSPPGPGRRMVLLPLQAYVQSTLSMERPPLHPAPHGLATFCSKQLRHPLQLQQQAWDPQWPAVCSQAALQQSHQPQPHQAAARGR